MHFIHGNFCSWLNMDDHVFSPLRRSLNLTFTIIPLLYQIASRYFCWLYKLNTSPSVLNSMKMRKWLITTVYIHTHTYIHINFKLHSNLELFTGNKIVVVIIDLPANIYNRRLCCLINSLFLTLIITSTNQIQ
jgi:hypothetical protein